MKIFESPRPNLFNSSAVSLLILGLVTATLGFGCSKDQSKEAPQNQQEFKVNGQTATDYFGQFTADVKGSCSELEKMSFRLVEGANMDIVLESNAEYRITASIRIALNKDGSYVLKFHEQKVMDAPGNMGGTITIPTTDDQTISGHWSVQANEIILSDLGKGTGIKLNGQDAIELHIAKFVLNSNVVGGVVSLTRTYSSSDIEGKSAASHCNQ